ncbi:monoacylglycerol lipase ABHD2-like [Physella acuta]|uniref:monoacylglycerol lipase ABHD2-like n=1 Tax=Physella acuta TaxID=109671 RepID=UPI0027DB429E|nr:monoacylglycerol lipase ABHD2-like [Physella acuta]XP_059173588.1 monoacylglycerol lipase ABHD2-like [Physella acuta]XP_059173590.1 monoacylglycerol lipase ABHD2-like [Physella acuta]
MLVPLFTAIFALLLYLFVRLFHLTTPAAAPLIYAKDQSSQFVQSILLKCPTLHRPYTPPLLWGKSGHAQTIAYAKMGRVNMPVPSGVRHTKVMADGVTLTFDLHEPLAPHKSGGNFSIILCPGIGNNSESPYIRTLVDYAQRSGYTAVVLNHVGSTKTIQLTGSRIFTYGGTEELGEVRREVERLKPGSGIILVGCSMGANVVVKYLGERLEHQQGILGAVSISQGYDVIKAKPLLLSWKHLRRLYIYVMTRNQKNLIRCHQQQLLSQEVKAKYGIDEAALFAARTMEELDEAYTRRRHGYTTLDDYYYHNSSCHYLCNIKIPLLVVNAEDDPIVPKELLECPLQASKCLPHMIFAVTKHGGHLGFFENGIVHPDSLTWMDRLIIEYADAITELHTKQQLPHQGSIHDDNMAGDYIKKNNNTHGKEDTLSKDEILTNGKDEILPNGKDDAPVIACLNRNGVVE